MYIMKPYDDALRLILEQGSWKSNNRTGIRTKYICGILSKYRINDFFPLLTRRKVFPKSILAELLWFISGSTSNKDLQKLGANFWTPWVDKNFENAHGYAEGCLGPLYGFQLRHFNGYYGNGIGGRRGYPKETGGTFEEYRKLTKGLGNLGYGSFTDDPNKNPSLYGLNGYDQLDYIMKTIKDDPTSRRIMFSLWNPLQLDEMRLAPCHFVFQITIDDDNRMSGSLLQRSADYPVGACYNVVFYSALIYMIAQQTGYEPYELSHYTVDSHIYENQIDKVKEYLDTDILDSPKLKLNKAKDIYSYKVEDFEWLDYKSGPKIEIPVAV